MSAALRQSERPALPVSRTPESTMPPPAMPRMSARVERPASVRLVGRRLIDSDRKYVMRRLERLATLADAAALYAGAGRLQPDDVHTCETARPLSGSSEGELLEQLSRYLDDVGESERLDALQAVVS